MYAHVKKVLALVLAFAMAFTMMATAGAAYTDQADIQATEAVEMLNALGIMTGDPDGSFRPNDTITRAEACRMIYTIRTNSDDASAYADMQTTFQDVPADAWYAGYVKHCQAAGIVSGTSADGSTFEPSRDVTGVELALMCLRVMGYDPAKADIGGSTWSTKTIGLATEAGLLDGVSTTITSACPRQWAAQLMYNTIDARTVRWSNDSETYTDLDMGGGKMDKVGQKYLGLYSDIGTVVAIKGSDMTISITKEDAPDSYHSVDANNNYIASTQTFTKLAQNYTQFLGQRVKVMFKDGKMNSVIGVYAMDGNNAYVVDAKDVESDGAKVKFNGTSYTLDGAGATNTIEVWGVDINGDASPVGTGTNHDVYDQPSTYFDDADQKAISYTFVDNDGDGKLEYAIATEAIAVKVTYASSTQIVAGGETYKFSDENIDENLVKDDWAVISYNRYDECKDIVKADVITGTLNATKEGTLSDKTKFDQYRIGDTWYNAAVETAQTELKTVNAGDTVEAVAANGVLFYIKRTSAGSNGNITDVALLLDTDTVVGTNKASIALFDGTKKVVDVDSDTKVTLTPGKVYEYSVSGDEYTFTALKTGTTSYKEYYSDFTAYDSGIGAVKGQKNESLTISGSTYKIADTAKVLLYANNDRKYITGKQFKNLTLDSDSNTQATAAFVGEMDGLTRVGALAVSVKTLPDNLDTNDNYAYILDNAVKSGNNQITYPIWTGSQKIDVVEDYSGVLSNRQAGLVIGYKSIDTENNNKIDDVSIKKMNVANIESKSDNDKTLNVLKQQGTAFADNTVAFGEHDVADATVIYVNSDNDYKASEEGGNIGIMEGSMVTSDYASVLFLLNGDDFELLVVDVKGKFVDNPYVVDTAAPALTAGAASGTLTFGGTSNVTIDVTPKNFAVKGGTGSDKDDITNNTVSIVIKDASGADKTSTFDTITPVNLTKNDTKATQTITQKADTAAGEYTVEITADGITATSKLVINEKDIASGSLPSYAIGGSVSNTTPVAGNRLSNVTGTITPATNTTAQYEWTVNGKSVAADTIVASGDKLVLKVTLTAEANYKFADPFTATVSEIGTSTAAAGTVARVDDSTVTITYAELTVA